MIDVMGKSRHFSPQFPSQPHQPLSRYAATPAPYTIPPPVASWVGRYSYRAPLRFAKPKQKALAKLGALNYLLASFYVFFGFFNTLFFAVFRRKTCSLFACGKRNQTARLQKKLMVLRAN